MLTGRGLSRRARPLLRLPGERFRLAAGHYASDARRIPALLIGFRQSVRTALARATWARLAAASRARATGRRAARKRRTVGLGLIGSLQLVEDAVLTGRGLSRRDRPLRGEVVGWIAPSVRCVEVVVRLRRREQAVDLFVHKRARRLLVGDIDDIVSVGGRVHPCRALSAIKPCFIAWVHVLPSC